MRLMLTHIMELVGTKLQKIGYDRMLIVSSRIYEF
jgi:hypothetical protein